MNTEMKRIAFAEAFSNEIQSDPPSILALWSEEFGAFNNAECQIAWNMWQAALAQRGPVAEGEVAQACKHLGNSSDSYYVYIGDLLERTEAARLAAENKAAHFANLFVRTQGEQNATDQLNVRLQARLTEMETQLTAERARSEKLVAAAKRLSEQANRNQQYVMLYHLQSLDEALAAYQSSKEAE